MYVYVNLYSCIAHICVSTISVCMTTCDQTRLHSIWVYVMLYVYAKSCSLQYSCILVSEPNAWGTLDSVACRYFVKRYCRDALDYHCSYSRQAPCATLSILFHGNVVHVWGGGRLRRQTRTKWMACFCQLFGPALLPWVLVGISSTREREGKNSESWRFQTYSDR